MKFSKRFHYIIVPPSNVWMVFKHHTTTCTMVLECSTSMLFAAFTGLFGACRVFTRWLSTIPENITSIVMNGSSSLLFQMLLVWGLIVDSIIPFSWQSQYITPITPCQSEITRQNVFNLLNQFIIVLHARNFFIRERINIYTKYYWKGKRKTQNSLNYITAYVIHFDI